VASFIGCLFLGGIRVRKLQSTDFFTFTKIIKKMGIREELKGLAKIVADVKLEEKDVAVNKMQIEIIMIFIENISSAEKEVYKFIADISGKTLDELKDLDVFMGALQEIFFDETIKSFFKLALK
jgi:hypothetical protein